MSDTATPTPRDGLSDATFALLDKVIREHDRVR